MNAQFSNFVEEVKLMSREDKEELRFLIDRYLIEEKREEIDRHYQESQADLDSGRLSFSNDPKTLRSWVRE